MSQLDLLSAPPRYDSSVINQALNMIRDQVEGQPVLTSPQLVRDFIELRIAPSERELFLVLFLDNRLSLIADEVMFAGTIDSASVYPREVAKRALQLNAAAVIFAHNHPSGIAEPSQADIRLTSRLVSALGLFDIRVLDHLVVGGGSGSIVSFAERGLL